VSFRFSSVEPLAPTHNVAGFDCGSASARAFCLRLAAFEPSPTDPLHLLLLMKDLRLTTQPRRCADGADPCRIAERSVRGRGARRVAGGQVLNS
jgi:hypothetical protein